MAEKEHNQHGGEGGGHGEKSGGHARKRHGHGGHGGGGHEEGHEGAPEWLISFADMVMLMMGFFVILFCLKVEGVPGPSSGLPGDDTKPEQGSSDFVDFAIAVRAAFNNPVDLSSKDPRDQALIQRMIERGKARNKQEGLKGQEKESESIRPSEYHAMSGAIPFSDGSSELSAAGRDEAGAVARKMRGRKLIIEVRGHANAAEAFATHDRGMSLAMQRAMSVAEVLAANGVDWWQMRLVAAADNDRVEAFPGDRDTDRANSRVEVIVTDEVMPALTPGAR